MTNDSVYSDVSPHFNAISILYYSHVPSIQWPSNIKVVFAECRKLLVDWREPQATLLHFTVGG